MIAWAKYSGPLAPELQPGPWVAYSIRPDFWPPGWGDVRVPGQGYMAYYALPFGTRGLAAEAELQGLGDPGVAEAMVLAGDVLIEIRGDLGAGVCQGGRVAHWTPCEEPHDP